jgi:hypothetical protein
MHRRPRLLFAVALSPLALACSQAKPSSRANTAPGTIASDAITIAGPVQSHYDVLIKTFTESGYRKEFGRSNGSLTFFSFAEAKALDVHMTPVGADSTRVEFTGMRFVNSTKGSDGDTPYQWLPITNGDRDTSFIYAAPTRLTHAIRARAAKPIVRPSGPVTTEVIISIPPPTSNDTLLRDLPNGRKGYCLGNNMRNDRLAIIDVVTLSDWCPMSPRNVQEFNGRNTYVLGDPAQVKLGETMEICAVSGRPHGFEFVEGINDPKRCPFNKSYTFDRDVNVWRVKRVSFEQ